MSLEKDDDGFVTHVSAPSTSGAVDTLTADLGAALPNEDDALNKDPIGLLKSDYEVEITLADQQADPTSPLYSVKSFDELGLTPELAKGVRAMGFVRPSKIQERALPLMLMDPPTNMIAQSQAGTGKTAAFTLAMLSRIDATKPETQAICLAPTRELARQIMSVVAEMGKFTTVTTGYAIKETPASQNAHIVVGTAGTLLDQLSKGIIDPRKLKVFVLDEADNMLEKGALGDQTLRVKNRVPKTVQTLLFSATFPSHVRSFATKFAPRANEIMLKTEELSVEGIKQFYMDCTSEQQKFEVLVQIYSLLTVGQSIIFVQRRSTADSVAARMIAEGHKVTSLTGTHQSGDRDQTFDDFRDGRTKVLITTNVVARGIDILQVNLVINYDLPLNVNGEPDVETYLHRIGRTGRFGRKGVSINFVHDKPTWAKMHYIEAKLGRPIERISPEDTDEMERILRSALKEKGQVAGSGGPSLHQSCSYPHVGSLEPAPVHMVSRTGKAKTITVVVPRHGTPTASHALMKAVVAEAKKAGNVFQEQDQISATELQGLEDASNWNGLLLNARGVRGPQWDVTSQMYHVDFGSDEYFNPRLLQEEPVLTTEKDTAQDASPQQDVNMAMNASPTHAYPQRHGQEGMRLQGPPGHSGYPAYGQIINGAYHRPGTGGESMGVNPMYPQHPQHPMHARMGPEMSAPPQLQQHMYGRPSPGMDMSRQQPQQQHGIPVGGLSYNNHAGQGHGMDSAAMGMGGGYGGAPPNVYGHGPGGMPTGGPHYPRGGPGTNGSYGGMYP